METIIKDSDFKKMYYDPVNISKSLFKQYPQLSERFSGYENDKKVLALGIERVVTYIILMYDELSPLRSLDNYGKRRIEAIRYAKFPPDIVEEVSSPRAISEAVNIDEEDFDEEDEDKPKSKGNHYKSPAKIVKLGPMLVLEMATHRIPAVNKMIVEYIRSYRNFDYSYLVGMEAVYYQALEKMLSNQADAKDVELVNKYRGQMAEAFRQLYGQETGAQVEETLISIEESRLNLRPEDIANAIANQRYFSFLKR